ncbi:MAG TPA: phosphoribosylglycinamide formyltransferase [Phycisphaerae bacterium]|nr:phosphoribosylglycinamide formyltransferase [Phycisphaerae bacterium]
MRDEPLRIGVLVSGGGRSVLNLADCIARGEIPARIAVVISSRGGAPAVERCRAAGLPVAVVERTAVAPAAFHAEITERLRTARAELVVMAGFLSRWEIPEDFAGRVINIHPALLPRFGGKGFYGDHVHRAVLAAGEQESGCSVHFADDQYDHGPVILQRRVPVLPEDTPTSLAARVFAEETVALPQVVRMFATGQLALPR